MTIMRDNMTKYVALLVSPDGEFVPDFKEDSIEKVQEDLANMGTRWYFYPYIFIVKVPEDLSKNITKPGLFRDAYTGVPIATSPEGKFIAKRISRSKIVDVATPGVATPESLKFMKGWTVGRAIKKIATENAKLEEGDPLWGRKAHA